MNLLLLQIKVVDDHTDKQIKHEKTAQHHETNKEYLLARTIVLLWCKMPPTSIYRLKHYIFPSFRSHYCKHGFHSLKNVVKIVVSVDPLTTVIVALPHSLKMQVFVWDVFLVAGPKHT